MAQLIALKIHAQTAEKQRSLSSRDGGSDAGTLQGRSFLVHPSSHLLLHEKSAHKELIGFDAVPVGIFEVTDGRNHAAVPQPFLPVVRWDRWNQQGRWLTARRALCRPLFFTLSHTSHILCILVFRCSTLKSSKYNASTGFPPQNDPLSNKTHFFSGKRSTGTKASPSGSFSIYTRILAVLSPLFQYCDFFDKRNAPKSRTSVLCPPALISSDPNMCQAIRWVYDVGSPGVLTS